MGDAHRCTGSAGGWESAMATVRSQLTLSLLTLLALSALSAGQPAPAPVLQANPTGPVTLPDTPAPEPAEPVTPPVTPAVYVTPTPATQPAEADAADALADQPLRGPSVRSAQETRTLSTDGAPSSLAGWLRTGLALAVVLGLILGLRWLMLRRGSGLRSGGAGGALEVLGRSALSPRHQVALVRVGRRVLVVGLGPEGLRTLSEITDPLQVSELLGSVQQARPDSLSGSFAQLMQSWRGSEVLDVTVDDDEDTPQPTTPAGGAAEKLAHLLTRIRRQEGGTL